MAILRKNQEFWLGKDPASRIYYDVRYQGPGYNQTAFFAAVPQNQGSLKGMEGVEWCESAKGKSNGAYGFKAETETKAIDKLKKFMVDDYNQGVKKEKMLFIDNDAESKSPFSDHREFGKRTITFAYQVVVKVTRKDKVKYFELNGAGMETSSEASEHGISIVPWTEQREANCKLILHVFDSIQKRINEMVSTDAIGMLEKNIGLLLAPSEPQNPSE